MRLTDFEINAITTIAKQHFGNDAQVYLFGSRTDDSKRGGDIDLFVSNKNEQMLTLNAKVKFLTDLMLQIGEQRVDVVLDYPAARNSPFYQTIQQTYLPLC
jgi:predicted nucleotidyltransferase